MVYIMVHDYVSALNLLQYCKTMDLSICNRYGLNAAQLGNMLTADDFIPLKKIKNENYIKINYKIFMEELRSYPTFKKGLENSIDYGLISPYNIPDTILSFQAGLSVGYYERRF